ncbi:MAG: hypothetical protein A3J49_03755 [Gallionellales bacterium RIFCSPHIGHO2_02_FULL_57_16]|nr:MAG: hypothetical protein A3J49_03755 [Gallionellales bacterium RIFCSPHIGHO2_02_FULL_57_16]
MKNFLSRLSPKKWLLAISVYVFSFLFMMFMEYRSELNQIRSKSQEHFGGDITANLGFIEVLKSSDFDPLGVAWRLLFYVLIPCLIIAAYFFDYKNEAHAGLKRVYISVQFIIPGFIALYLIRHQINDTRWVETMFAYIWLFGMGEAAVLILLQILKWVREGFAKPFN